MNSNLNIQATEGKHSDDKENTFSWYLIFFKKFEQMQFPPRLQCL